MAQLSPPEPSPAATRVPPPESPETTGGQYPGDPGDDVGEAYPLDGVVDATIKRPMRRSTDERQVLPFEKPLADLEQKIADLETLQGRSDPSRPVDYTAELRQLRENHTSLLRKTYDGLSAWETVQVARHPQRPQFLDYVDMLCREFREIHGDRRHGDDRAIRCGLARIAGQKVMLIGQHKGRDTKEKIKCMFGCAHPEGYRKALRAMKLAEKFKLPIVTLVDTAGAYPGIGAEERGQGESIALNLLEMARLRTPIVSVVIGEGGSGGALGIAVADRVAMSQYAWYSVISPEGASSILFKDAGQAAKMAESLSLTSRDLMRLGVVDSVVPEPLGGAHRDPYQAAHHLGQYLAKALRETKAQAAKDMDALLDARYDKFRRLGEFGDPAADATAADTARSAG